MTEPSEPEEREWFCPGCGVREERYCIDEDGCCASCGADCCRMSTLRERLSKHGLHLVTDAEKRVLEAMAAADEMTLQMMGENEEDDLEQHLALACRRELARRGDKP